MARPLFSTFCERYSAIAFLLIAVLFALSRVGLVTAWRATNIELYVFGGAQLILFVLATLDLRAWSIGRGNLGFLTSVIVLFLLLKAVWYFYFWLGISIMEAWYPLLPNDNLLSCFFLIAHVVDYIALIAILAEARKLARKGRSVISDVQARYGNRTQST